LKESKRNPIENIDYQAQNSNFPGFLRNQTEHQNQPSLKKKAKTESLLFLIKVAMKKRKKVRKLPQ
jgi:hypothetical protein